MEYLGWKVTPEPDNERDIIFLKFNIEQTIKELPGYYWPGHIGKYLHYRITFIGDD